jgi:predicted glutamine amidotransferase
MCELMGMSFAQPISADFSVREFAMRQEGNADGWGLAWYPDKSAALVKEPLPSGESGHMRFLESYHGLQSRIYIAHVRHGTRGGQPTHADTHPFRRELNGHEYCFAHNGTVDYSADQLPLGSYHPIGGTDSEHTFCYLLQAIADFGCPLNEERGWQWLYDQAAAINRLGKFNFLMSDGERLFSYHDLGAWKGLNYRKVRFHRDQVRHLEDETIGVELENVAAAESDGGYNHGMIVATRPLSSTGWHTFTPGELLVIEQGTLRFSSHRASRA